ncbi:hypothetical protein Tsubulata_039481 [Turnera subulata]|uniref:PORR domain-containing protein n=1 Tax=Turnera subulata TaxID=218843 RepID=A0A9Q0G1N0_9ROSI|nr:hypothetical protein Tsubulata_039481 [Turnera subulata]
MAILRLSLPAQIQIQTLTPTFLPSTHPNQLSSSSSLHNLCSLTTRNPTRRKKNSKNRCVVSISCIAPPKIVKDQSLDKHVVRNSKIRFVQKLKTLLLSKPKHYIPIHILAKCRPYLALPKDRSLLSMIHRYPSIFELFSIPTPPFPQYAASRSLTQLCVRLTPAAAALATQERALHSSLAHKLAAKLQKLLMLSSHRRLLLSKLVHLAPDLGFPANFRSRLCNDYPDKFRTVDTSYGRALELVSWDEELAVPLPAPPDVSRELIVDRPLKFKHLRLRKGRNVKRCHRGFLIKFGELPDVCPYTTCLEEFRKESLFAEKRACAVVREVLGMTVEKRTVIDHLTHFRKEFGLSNKLRGMLVRHPDLFYVSLKGLRDSVFLVEGFDSKGKLLQKDETLVIKERLMELVTQGKKMRRERRKAAKYGYIGENGDVGMDDDDDNEEDEYDDGFENIFESEDAGLDFDVFEDDVNGYSQYEHHLKNREFWTADASSIDGSVSKDPW